MAGPHIGIALTTIAEPGDDVSSLDDIPARARDVEDAGLDAIWVPDVVTGDKRPALEVMTVLAAAAGATSRIGLGTCILALPLRQLAWTATQIQTVQYISGNRLVLGVGIGGFNGEPFWRAVHAPTKRRGAWLDAALDTLPRLVAGDEVDPDGGGVPIALQPAAPMPPLRVAGNADAALVRAARHGGWFGGGAGSGGAETLRPELDRLRHITAELGVPMPRVTVAPEVTIGVGPAARKARDERAAGLVADGFMTADEAARIPTAESVAQVVDALGAYLDVGVDEIVTGVAGVGDDWRRGVEFLVDARDQLRQ
ncbi:LLM class flavin-dependent oxidoreductase [Phytoactinopolyspora limicola]|uniref:LLM class flavin-dependent oxidoreductase n=1 Tax=Phytoactinopolyspora limicola TaxID=2715536 RepID=UPI00140E248C|nr:LLM class flavin-dependent oxidoreductase [Phytoactinopolyspora limicola]